MEMVLAVVSAYRYLHCSLFPSGSSLFSPCHGPIPAGGGVRGRERGELLLGSLDKTPPFLTELLLKRFPHPTFLTRLQIVFLDLLQGGGVSSLFCAMMLSLSQPPPFGYFLGVHVPVLLHFAYEVLHSFSHLACLFVHVAVLEQHHIERIHEGDGGQFRGPGVCQPVPFRLLLLGTMKVQDLLHERERDLCALVLQKKENALFPRVLQQRIERKQVVHSSPPEILEGCVLALVLAFQFLVPKHRTRSHDLGQGGDGERLVRILQPRAHGGTETRARGARHLHGHEGGRGLGSVAPPEGVGVVHVVDLLELQLSTHRFLVFRLGLHQKQNLLHEHFGARLGFPQVLREFHGRVDPVVLRPGDREALGIQPVLQDGPRGLEATQHECRLLCVKDGEAAQGGEDQLLEALHAAERDVQLGHVHDARGGSHGQDGKVHLGKAQGGALLQVDGAGKRSEGAEEKYGDGADQVHGGPPVGEGEGEGDLELLLGRKVERVERLVGGVAPLFSASGTCVCPFPDRRSRDGVSLRVHVHHHQSEQVIHGKLKVSAPVGFGGEVTRGSQRIEDPLLAHLLALPRGLFLVAIEGRDEIVVHHALEPGSARHGEAHPLPPGIVAHPKGLLGREQEAHDFHRRPVHHPHGEVLVRPERENRPDGGGAQEAGGGLFPVCERLVQRVLPGHLDDAGLPHRGVPAEPRPVDDPEGGGDGDELDIEIGVPREPDILAVPTQCPGLFGPLKGAERPRLLHRRELGHMGGSDHVGRVQELERDGIVVGQKGLGPLAHVLVGRAESEALASHTDVGVFQEGERQPLEALLIRHVPRTDETQQGGECGVFFLAVLLREPEHATDGGKKRPSKRPVKQHGQGLAHGRELTRVPQEEQLQAPERRPHAPPHQPQKDVQEHEQGGGHHERLVHDEQLQLLPSPDALGPLLGTRHILQVGLRQFQQLPEEGRVSQLVSANGHLRTEGDQLARVVSQK
mmetsp:Transcript_11556/g.30763  ORF Transcript_11556/g.30763 Transcript_11556/m.30763 type:complete len:972 (+) Transcript_11556:169-3084(+)